MKITERTVKIVSCDELQKVVDEKFGEGYFELFGHYFDYSSFGDNCYMDLNQEINEIEKPWDGGELTEWDKAYNNVLMFFKELFGNDDVMVYLSY